LISSFDIPDEVTGMSWKRVVVAVQRKRVNPCPIEVALSAIGARWKAMVIWRLRDGPLSYSALRATLPPQVAERVLSEQLRQLREDGVIDRRLDADGRPVHRLTDLGHALMPSFAALHVWGSRAQADRAEATSDRPRAEREPRRRDDAGLRIATEGSPAAIQAAPVIR